jgi:Tol biopolymer transport system component
MDISPARSELLVANSPVLGESQLTVLPVPAGSPHRLGNVIAHDGTWSLDGQRIVYASGSDLYSARSNGSERQKIVSSAGYIMWPRWSPDGRTLRFTVFDAGGWSIWEVRGDGTDLHPLLPGWNSPPAECCGNWTPDGKYFVFQSARKGRVGAIYGQFVKRARTERPQAGPFN